MTTRTTIGIFGLGTVGTGVVELLRDMEQFEIRTIAVRDLGRARDTNFSDFELTDDPFRIADDPEIDILVEVAGGIDPAYQVV
ncbi:MAG: hypothetical protein IPO77_08345 [Acidobacteria bacterium]|nr:hypothetical protein [Acidobacteriota bacterium]